MLAIRKELSRRAQEFRSIQKRMLVRFKDKSPAPMANMDTLMETAYAEIMGLADRWEEEQVSGQARRSRACCLLKQYMSSPCFWDELPGSCTTAEVMCGDVDRGITCRADWMLLPLPWAVRRS